MPFLGFELDYKLIPAGHLTYFQAVQQDGFWVGSPNGRFKWSILPSGWIWVLSSVLRRD